MYTHPRRSVYRSAGREKKISKSKTRIRTKLDRIIVNQYRRRPYETKGIVFERSRDDLFNFTIVADKSNK